MTFSCPAVNSPSFSSDPALGSVSAVSPTLRTFRRFQPLACESSSHRISHSMHGQPQAKNQPSRHLRRIVDHCRIAANSSARASSTVSTSVSSPPLYGDKFAYPAFCSSLLNTWGFLESQTHVVILNGFFRWLIFYIYRSLTSSLSSTIVDGGPLERIMAISNPIPGTEITQLLGADPRPAFVISLTTAEHSSVPSLVYQNPALEARFDLSRQLHLPSSHISTLAFWKWVRNTDNEQEVLQKASFGMLWTKFRCGRWLVLSAAEPPSLSPERPRKRPRIVDIVGSSGLPSSPSPPKRPPVGDRSISEPEPESRAPVSVRVETDVEMCLPDLSVESELFADTIRNIDWKSHRLGPMEGWSSKLRQVFNQILADSRPIAAFWGPDHIALYNEAFSRFCGAKHPGSLGANAITLWPHLKEPVDTIWRSKAGAWPRIDDEARFFVEQADGTIEETYGKWSLTPITDRQRCVGVYHSLVDTTPTRLWDRRMKMLLDLGEGLIAARDVQSYWETTLRELERWSPSYDVPLAFIYSIAPVGKSQSNSSSDQLPQVCHLEGSLGVPAGHPIAPPTLSLQHSEEGLAKSIRKACKGTAPVLLQVEDGSLPEHLLDGLEWRGFGDPIQAAIICPIRPIKEQSVMGVLFLGLNPRRTYDHGYRQFLSLLNQKLASSLASTVLLQTETERAASDRQSLEKQLQIQTEQANQSTQTLIAVSKFVPVGMAFGNPNGDLTFANDAWFNIITGQSGGTLSSNMLLESAFDDDRPKIRQAYEELIQTGSVTFEFRLPDKFRRSSEASIGAASHMDDLAFRHVLASAKVERYPDGSIMRVLTCLTEVTDQKHATEQALKKAQEAENLKRLAELATVGLYDMSLDGHLLSANNTFWELSGLEKVDLTTVSVDPWTRIVVEEDLPLLWGVIERLKRNGRTETAEIRFRTTWMTKGSDGKLVECPRSVLATFLPVKSTDGTLQSFTGCLSDVSVQKWQLEQETLRKNEAIESKRQQENFIDMTSHEMRNPLSAMLHCSDAIVASLGKFQSLRTKERLMPPSPGNGDGVPQEDNIHSMTLTHAEQHLLSQSINDAETIISLAQHQKCIVDDILTMSKLDTNLLTVTPVTTRPEALVSEAVRMFEAEARRVDVALTFEIHRSFHELNRRFLDLDPSRVNQILINLLTNALKFTKSVDMRSVTVTLKGSLTIPSDQLTTVKFLPTSTDNEYSLPTSRGRNPVYLLFEVADTGAGLTSDEKSRLFDKFVQANAKTHTKYGGSGLGLFISRRLTELQYGAIGVTSEPGIGTTFAFYIEAYEPNEGSRHEAEREEEARDAARKKRLSKTRPGTMTPVEGSSKEKLISGVLVVEDNLVNQAITRKQLASKGYRVDVANHGLEAIEQLQKSFDFWKNRQIIGDDRAACDVCNYDGANGKTENTRKVKQPVPFNMILMDMEMPIMNGLEATQKIREMETNGGIFCANQGRIPIIAVTANARSEQVARALQAGCDDVLTKPYRIPELVEKMETLVKRVQDEKTRPFPLKRAETV